MSRLQQRMAQLAVIFALLMSAQVPLVAAQEGSPPAPAREAQGVGSPSVPPADPAIQAGCTYVAPSDRPVLRRGSTGNAVKQVQCLINTYSDYPYWLTVDGIFGSQTENAVRYVQSCHRIRVDGVVGSQTWPYLYNPLPQCAL